MNIYRLYHTKNYDWCFSFGIFPKTAKEVSKVYRTGIHLTKSEGYKFNIFLTIHLFRIVITFPYGKGGGDCNGI